MRFALLGVVMLLTGAGCASLQEYQSERLYHRLAADAWRAAPMPYDGPDARHFERGWKQGYYDLARGGDGSLPLLPPQPYWSFKYQNPEGQQIIRLWFEAYALGTQAAQADGAQNLHYIPLSPEAMQSILAAPSVSLPALEELPIPEPIGPAPVVDPQALDSLAVPEKLSSAEAHQRSPLGDAESALRIELDAPPAEVSAAPSESRYPPIIEPVGGAPIDRRAGAVPRPAAMPASALPGHLGALHIPTWEELTAADTQPAAETSRDARSPNRPQDNRQYVTPSDPADSRHGECEDDRHQALFERLQASGSAGPQLSTPEDHEQSPLGDTGSAVRIEIEAPLPEIVTAPREGRYLPIIEPVGSAPIDRSGGAVARPTVRPARALPSPQGDLQPPTREELTAADSQPREPAPGVDSFVPPSLSAEVRPQAPGSLPAAEASRDDRSTNRPADNREFVVPSDPARGRQVEGESDRRQALFERLQASGATAPQLAESSTTEENLQSPLGEARTAVRIEADAPLPRILAPARAHRSAPIIQSARVEQGGEARRTVPRQNLSVSPVRRFVLPESPRASQPATWDARSAGDSQPGDAGPVESELAVSKRLDSEPVMDFVVTPPVPTDFRRNATIRSPVAGSSEIRSATTPRPDRSEFTAPAAVATDRQVANEAQSHRPQALFERLMDREPGLFLPAEQSLELAPILGQNLSVATSDELQEGASELWPSAIAGDRPGLARGEPADAWQIAVAEDDAGHVQISSSAAWPAAIAEDRPAGARTERSGARPAAEGADSPARGRTSLPSRKPAP